MMWKSFLLAACAFGFAAGAACAEPSVSLSGSRFTVDEGFTDAVASKIKEDMGKVDQKNLKFYLKKFKNDDLAKLCSAYPEIRVLEIRNSSELTSIAPVAGLKNLVEIQIDADGVKDLTPLAGLVNMENIDVKSSLAGPDLKWMSGMSKLKSVTIRAGKGLTSFEGIPSVPNLSRITLSGASPASLEPLQALSNVTRLDLSYCTIADLTPLTKLAKMNDLNLYGAKLKDFSPLAGCPALRSLMYYAVEGADFSTLGKLKQIQTLKGGLTKLDDISWVAELPELRNFDVFAEYIKDYSPLAKTKVTDFQIWNMHEPVDLKTLSGAVSLKKLKLWMLKDAVGFEGLGSLVNMEELILDTVAGKDAPVDMSFVKNMAQLKDLQLNKCEVANLNALASCAALEGVTLTEVKGVDNLNMLKKLAGLKSLTVTKGAFPDAELTGFAGSVSINQQ